MRPNYPFALLVILLASANCFGQGVLTLRRHQNSQQADTSSTPSAQPREQAATSVANPLPASLPVSAIKINARIEGQVSTVRVEHFFRNETDEALEGTYYFPLPEGATLLEFAVYDGDQRRTGRVKEKDEARAAYSAAVEQGDDPAILEMTKRGWFQSHVYPIAPRSDKRIEIIYSQVLADKDGVIAFDYPLGRGYKKLKVDVEKVEIEVDLRSEVAIKNFFSPTHPLDIQYDGDRHAMAKITTTGGNEAENFQLVYSLSNEEIGMSLMTYRKKGEDGYFLLMLSPKVEFDKQRISAKDVTFVIDASGSMDGDKLKQAKEALRFGLTRTLNGDDRFNIIAFDTDVQPMAKELVPATRANIERALAFIDKLEAGGETNITDALVNAMRMFERGTHPNNVVFVTDGQGNDPPDQTLAKVVEANTVKARLFTFGVGSNVNQQFLEQLAAQNRGANSDIADQSQLGRELSTFFSKVSQPVLSGMQVDFGPVIVDRAHPAELPDLYTQSQIKIFGRYRNQEDLSGVTVTLKGRMNDLPQRYDFNGLHFPLFTDDKDFLPKLWATERVSALMSEIRISGERPELKQEIIDLAREFNLVTPYTSMYVPTTAELAKEKADSTQAMKNQDAAASASNLPVNGRRNYSQSAMLTASAATAPAGTVVDASGAVIPNATVKIKDRNTGATRTITTDETGSYNIAGLAPGTYQVEVDAPGFNKTTLNNVVVQPGQTATTGVTLTPESVTESLVVTATSDVLESSVSNLSATYEPRKIIELPSLAPVDSLARLASGVRIARLDETAELSAGASKPGEYVFWINGGRPLSTGFMLDGYDNNDIDGQPAISIRNFDAIEMLHVMTTRGAGDASATSASSIHLITRTGTNEFHGSLFDYHLNRRLGALSPLERRSGLDRSPKFRSDIFGGTFGGPVRRDRIFFFGSFLRETEVSSRFVDSTSSLLTPTARGLDELVRAFSSSPAVSDLIARGPIASRVGEPRVARTFLIPVLGMPIEFGEIVRKIPSKAGGYEAGTRFDIELTNRDRLQVGYWYTSRAETNSVGNMAAGNTGDRDARVQLGNLRWTRMLSPRSTNELSASLNRTRASIAASSNLASGNLGEVSGPAVTAGFRGLAYGANSFIPASHISALLEVTDTLTHSAGRRNLKLGDQERARLTRFDFLPGAGGHFSYASFDDFVLDKPAAITVAIGDPRSSFSELHHHFFIDDTWRARSNFTLSMGLSYENAGQPLNQLIDRIRKRESDPARALFDVRLPALEKIDRDNNNIAPRIGFAYTPHLLLFGRNFFGYDKTVFRGGVSLSYDQTAYRPLADAGASSPNVLLGVLTPANASALPIFPNAPDANGLRALLGSSPLAYARAQLASNYRTPSTLSWHLDVSRDFDKKLLFELAYVGSRGAGLIRQIDGNPLSDGSTGPIRVYESSGHSIYHSLQARADTRLTDRITGSIAYTFSKLIDDAPDNISTFGGSVGNPSALISPALQSFAQNPFDGSRGERGVSSLDRTRTLSASFVWDLPLRRNQTRFFGRLLGGWKASGIIEAASGSPFTPLQFIGNSPASSALFASIFSDRLGAVRPFAGNPNAAIDTVAFSNAANSFFHFFLNSDGTPFISPTGFIIADSRGFRPGSIASARFIYNDYAVEHAARARGLSSDAFGKTFAAGRPFGDIGRNTLVSPRLVNVNFALVKNTKLNEKVSLQFRSEFFNLFNHPNRAKPNSIVENAGGFGFADFGETDASPRRIRLALKLIF
jgi:Ca-activated chloride channel family protein